MIELIPSKEFPVVVVGVGIKRWERYASDAYGRREIILNKSGLMVWVDQSVNGCGPSSIQRESRCGFLLTKRPWMFCYWFQFKPQAWGEGGFIPGSEMVLYGRIGTGRWDPNMGGVIKLKFKIFGKQFVFGTWYGPGLRWD